MAVIVSAIDVTAVLNRVSHSFIKTGVGFRVSDVVNTNENGCKLASHCFITLLFYRLNCFMALVDTVQTGMYAKFCRAG